MIAIDSHRFWQIELNNMALRAARRSGLIAIIVVDYFYRFPFVVSEMITRVLQMNCTCTRSRASSESERVRGVSTDP